MDIHIKRRNMYHGNHETENRRFPETCGSAIVNQLIDSVLDPSPFQRVWQQPKRQVLGCTSATFLRDFSIWHFCEIISSQLSSTNLLRRTKSIPISDRTQKYGNRKMSAMEKCTLDWWIPVCTLCIRQMLMSVETSRRTLCILQHFSKDPFRKQLSYGVGWHKLGNFIYWIQELEQQKGRRGTIYFMNV